MSQTSIAELVPVDNLQRMVAVAVLADRVAHLDLWRALLESADDVDVCAVATTPSDLLAVVAQPEVVLIDTIDTAAARARLGRDVAAHWPAAAIVVVDSGVDAATVVERVRRADPSMTVLSRGTLQEARDTMRMSERRSPVVAYPRLTEREREVLERLSRGQSTAAIATDLRISVNTCRGYTRTLMAKLGAHSQLEVLAFVAEHGLPGDR